MDADRSARYQEISARQGRAGRTSARAVDRRTGAAVVVHRQAGAGQPGTDAARRSARLDHPALAPVLDVWVDDGDAVTVQAAIAGHRLDDGGGARAAADVLTTVFAPLAEGLDRLHASGLAHGALGGDAVVMARFADGRERPVLLGPPGAAADPGSDRRDLAALALRLCDPAPAGGPVHHGEDRAPPALRRALADAAAGTGREHASCAALVDHLRRAATARDPVTPKAAWAPRHRLNSWWDQRPRIVQTGFLVLAVTLAAVRVLGRDGDMATMHRDGRAWVVTRYGVAGGAPAPVPIVAGAATQTGEGLWLVAADGTVSVTGDAPPVERVAAGAPVVAAVSRPDGGLWLVTTDGRVDNRAGAPAVHVGGSVTAPIIDATAVPGTDGLWLLTANGMVALAGDGANPPRLPADPTAAAIAAHPTGGGWRVSAAGSIIEFGRAPTLADAAIPATAAVVRARPTPTGNGLWILLSNGSLLTAGDAAPLVVPATPAPAVDLVVAP